MTDRYQKIRAALAMGPTRGPWKVDKELGAYSWQWLIALDAGDRGRGIVIAETRAGIGQETANAAHIAACDPDTIRELLAERDQLAADLEAAREDAERWRALREMDGGEIYALLGDCDGIHPEQADAAIDRACGKEAA